MRKVQTDTEHTYEGIDLHNPTILVEKFMNWVCMIGLKYDSSRHIKRTWMHFTPGSHLDFLILILGILFQTANLLIGQR